MRKRFIPTLVTLIAALVICTSGLKKTGLQPAAAATSATFQNQSLNFESTGVTYANLPSYSGNGSKFVWCTNCVVASTCAAGGSGAWAWWNPNASPAGWACGASLPSNLVTTATSFAGDLSGSVPTATVVGIDGIPLDSTFASPTNNYAIVYNSSTSKFTLAAVSFPNSNVLVSDNQLSTNATITTSVATVGSLSIGVTMPASGGPFRATISWQIYGTANTGSQQVTGYITDGTNNFGGNTGNTISSGVSAVAAASGGVVSPVTYANSAGVTFTLKASTSANTFTAKPGTATTAPTYLNITVQPSV